MREIRYKMKVKGGGRLTCRLKLMSSVLALLLFSTGSFAQQVNNTSATVETLTLDEAISIALKENRNLRAAEIDVLKSREQTNALRTRFLPNAQVTALGSQPLNKFDVLIRRGQLGDFPNIGPIPAEDRKFGSSLRPNLLVLTQVNQPITQLYSLKLNYKASKIGEEIASESVRLSRQQITADVKKAYFGIMQAEKALQSAEEAVKFYRELRRITENFVAQGMALKPELKEAETKLAQSELDVYNVRNQLTDAKEQLNQLLGRDINNDVNVTPVPQLVDYTSRVSGLANAQQTAINQRPELRQAKLRREQAALDTRAKRWEKYPQVGGAVTLVSPVNYSSFLPNVIANAGVTVQYNFDWGRTRREVKEKELTQQQADLKLQELESSVLREVNLRFRQMQESGRTISVADLNRQTANAKLKVMLDRYEEGAVLFKDVLQAQTVVAEAEYRYQKAMLDFWTAKSEFEKAIGEEK